MVGEQDLAVYLSKFDKKYWLTYKVLDILQKVASPYCSLPDGDVEICLVPINHSWLSLHVSAGGADIFLLLCDE